ncbi:MAG: RNA pseudouridine synthase [Ruthenibacterium sp.]
MRLDQYVATAAQKSRTEVRKDILHGLVTVDGAVCKKAGEQVAETAAVTLNGAVLTLQKYVYIMLDKPLGVVSAAVDKNDTTVIDLVGKAYPRRNLFPAGRLDKASTGFVLITDDGNFAHEILAPKHHVAKTYEIVLDTPLTKAMTDGFAVGVKLADGEVMKPAIAVASGDNPCCATVVISQGVYHQIKRMFGVFDAGVEALRRTAIGGLCLDETLGAGGFKELSKEDLDKMTQQDSQPIQKINTGVV